MLEEIRMKQFLQFVRTDFPECLVFFFLTGPECLVSPMWREALTAAFIADEGRGATGVGHIQRRGW